MLAVLPIGHDPRNGGQPALLRKREEVGDWPDVVELLVVVHRLEVRKRVPDLRRPRGVRAVLTTVDDSMRTHVIGPAHMALMEQVGEIGPLVAVRVFGKVAAAVDVHEPDRARTIGRGCWRYALCRPSRNGIKVRRLTPADVWLKHPVLQHILLGIPPVVRYLPRVVIPHGVWSGGRLLAYNRSWVRFAVGRPLELLDDETVHLAAVDVLGGIDVRMGSSLVFLVGVVERLRAALL